ncbi:transcriptional regulator, XRE family [Dehalogenimonas lykanthroporepellens BL-DC-9]|uniref:helix-turn-helix domain-containing protein n=1 Tax=Candidatus Dehalogenimonas loeffleri TaxID=3127115 RepID=UPI0001DADB2E|nr:transcriptional regulator, XRE family [Dehalogenimonas lykanthroporepellens BL-DC-9]
MSTNNSLEHTIVKRLSEYRRLSGITQQELASRIGTKQPVISEFERMMNSLTLGFIERVANALGVEIKIRIQPGHTDDIYGGS